MSSSLRTPSLQTVLAVAGGLTGAALGAFGVRRACAARTARRTNPKLSYDLDQQIAALKEIYPRLTQEFIDDVKDKYLFPQYALDRLKRVRKQTET